MNRHLTEHERSALALDMVSPEEFERFDAHLAECKECREALRCDREMIGVIKEMSTPPDGSTGRWDRMVQKRFGGDKKEPARTGPDFGEAFTNWFWRAAVLAFVFAAGYWAGGAREALNAMRNPAPQGFVSIPANAEAPPSKPMPITERLVGMADDTRTELLGRTLATTCVMANTSVSTSSLNF